jgi:hypothetical protein
MRMRWKREKAKTGLAAVCAPPRGYEYYDGETLYATVSALRDSKRSVVGWYWVAGWDSDIPRKNTCGSPCATPEEAKTQAAKYVKHHIANAPGERCANSAYAPTGCSVCGKPHRLTELDAGSDQEFLRVCDKCFRKQNAESEALT